MPKCPKCGKEIDRLRSFLPIYDLTVDENGKEHYEFINYSPVAIKEHYICLKCRAVLFTDEEDAIKFLRGETLAKGE